MYRYTLITITMKNQHIYIYMYTYICKLQRRRGRKSWNTILFLYFGWTSRYLMRRCDFWETMNISQAWSLRGNIFQNFRLVKVPLTYLVWRFCPWWFFLIFKVKMCLTKDATCIAWERYLWKMHAFPSWNIQLGDGNILWKGKHHYFPFRDIFCSRGILIH